MNQFTLKQTVIVGRGKDAVKGEVVKVDPNTNRVCVQFGQNTRAWYEAREVKEA